jgi:hypothetical protein
VEGYELVVGLVAVAQDLVEEQQVQEEVAVEVQPLVEDDKS